MLTPCVINIKTIQALIEGGVKVDVKDVEGKTASDLLNDRESLRLLQGDVDQIKELLSNPAKT